MLSWTSSFVWTTWRFLTTPKEVWPDWTRRLSVRLDGDRTAPCVEAVLVTARSPVIRPRTGLDSVEAIAQAACGLDPELDVRTATELAAACFLGLADRPAATSSDLVDLCLASGDNVNIAFIVQVARATIDIAGTTDLSEPLTG